MPILGTPSGPGGQICCDVPETNQLPISPKDCRDMRILAAPVSQVNKQPLLSRMRAVKIYARQQATIDWQMHDQNGIPLNLTECVCDTTSSGSSAAAAADRCGNIQLRIWEVLNNNSDPSRAPRGYPAEIVAAETGHVRFDIPPASVGIPGIYYGEVAIIDKDAAGHEYTLLSNIFYLYIQPNNFTDTQGPPSIAEIRLHLRDSAGAESFLLDHVRFDDAEIALATMRPVQYWNETPPDICRYSTDSFPFRWHWLEAICAQLFLIATEHYRANNLSYTAAGLSIDDLNKEPNYLQAYQLREQTWRDFVAKKKYAMNAAAMFSYVDSPYSWNW